MPAIMADHDIEGQMQVLLRLLTSAEWHAFWTELAVRVESFASLGCPSTGAEAPRRLGLMPTRDGVLRPWCRHGNTLCSVPQRRCAASNSNFGFIRGSGLPIDT
jgi:hypothetical protein